MNQSTRRKTRHLLHFLLTWVIIGAQIALPLGALLAAVQPTPQMAQAVARQTGLGEWFLNAAGDLAAWGQPLWGQPKPAVAQTVAPGGVSSGLEAWVKADAGTSTTTDGATVATWSDQSGNSYDFTQATAGSQPTYYSTTTDKLLNFNPVLDFDGTGDYLHNTTVLMPSASPYTFLAVGVDEDTGTAYRKLFGSEAIVDYFGLYKQGGATGDNGWIPYAIGGQARSSPFIGDRGSMGKGTKYSADGGANGYWNGTNFTSDSRTDYAQPQIVGFNSLNNATSDPFYTWTDGYKEDPNWSPIVDGLVFRNQFFSQTSIGADVTVELWKGRIPEFMAYSQSLSDSDIAKINSYLAIKYGITLGQGNGHVGKNGNNYNYVATDGTVIWDASANSTYAYNIAGIGRDDAEDLQQKQAKSIQAGFQPVIGLGSIAATNAANSGVFSANKSYLIWGDNGQAANFSASYNPISFTPAAGYYRMDRVWKVQESGTITNVVVQATDADHLLVSSDPTFATGVTEIDMSSGSATVNFANGQYFTFGRELVAPGGVSAGLGVWLRADQGSSTTTDGQAVADWADFGPGGNDVTQPTAGNQPKFKEVNLNFNPALEFDGSNDVLYKSDGTTIIPNQTDPVSMLTVSTQRAGSGWWQTLLSFSGAADYPALHWLDGRQALYIDGVQDFRHSTVIPYNTPTMFVSRANNATPRDLRMANNGLSNQDTSTVGSGTFPAASGSKLFSVGSELATGSETLNGFMNEGIVYNRFLSDAEVNRIHTYFAVKYGITFDNGATNYVATDGTTVIWDATANSGYKSNIAGIGRDDAEALHQKQSLSINSGFQPTIGLGAIAATNTANTNTFSANKSYLIWGDNGQAATFATVYNPTSFTPAAGYYRMDRVWKVQETGTITNVVVQATGADHLLVSSDPTFATGVTEIDMSSGSATVNFTNGQFFTFGRELTAPGGVATNLTFWYKPEAGVSLDSGKVSSWVDQANGIAVTPAAASNGPTYYDSGANLINFNPTLNFTNATRQDGLRANSGLPAIPNGVSTFSVLLPDDASNRWFLQWGVSGAGYYNNYGHCNSNNPGVWTNSHGGCVNNPTTLGPLTTPSFLSSRWNSTAGTNQWQLRRNGQLHSGTTTATALNVPADTALEIGDVNQRTAGNEYIGNISEVIGYTARVSDTDLQKIESYLAIKYGVTYMNDANTAARNYLNAAGATVWDATANSAYSSNIAGLGRDDASDLTQKQAKSVNSGFQVTIGLGAIAASNAANNNSFSANNSFLLWGDNGQVASYGASYTPGSFTPAAGYYRMNRVWKVQETGTITAVVVMADGAEHLLVSSDPTFATGVTEIAFSSGSATVDFSNGQYFTFGQTATGPGGVANNLAAWYKADGTIGTTQWDDESGNNKHMLAAGDGTAARMPILETTPGAANNFNPRVAFLSNADGSRKWTMTASGNNVFPNTTTPGTIFNVSSFPDETVYDVPQMYAFEDDDPGLNLFTDRNANNDIRVVFQRDNGGTGSAGWDFVVPGVSQTKPLLTAHAWNYAAGGNTFSFNGYDFTPSSNSFIGATSPRYIFGAELTNGGGEAHSGYTSENIVYTVDWPSNSSERKRINSYLAVKYGITLLGTGTLGGGAANATFGGTADYLDSASTVIWSGTTTNSSYHNNVAGIGRDDASALHQKQSVSVNDGFQLVIGLGAIAASNAANSNSFSANKSFLLWGDNNGALTLSAAYNGGSNNRVARVWKVQETGTVGAVKVVIPRSAFPTVGLRSLIVHASDPAFGTVDRTYMLVSTGGNYEATVDFNNGDFFTFSSSLTVPEINVTPGTLDFGEVNTGSTSPAQAVTIQNQGEVSLSLSNISLSGTDAARFAISSNNCGATLSAGASCTVQITFAPTTTGSRSAQLVITNNDSDEGTVNVALSGTTPGSNGGGTSGTYNLAVTKSASTANATVGVPFTYTITVLNKGTIAASNVTMTDQLPASVTFGSANATGGGTCTHNSGTITCTWASLAGGASATVTISVTP